MKIRSIIVDDESIAREVLENYIKKYCPVIEVIGQAQHIKEAVPMIQSLQPQLVFLDVELIDGSGFDVLKKVGTINFEIIVITSYDKYALTAIKYSALDYLIKPIQFPELETALKKVKKRFPPEENKSTTHKPIRLINKVAVPTLEGLSFIPIHQRMDYIFHNDFFLPIEAHVWPVSGGSDEDVVEIVRASIDARALGARNLASLCPALATQRFDRCEPISAGFLHDEA